MPLAYYNEIDPYAAQWLRNLIDAGHIARGIVDTRSIEDVHPRDLDGFTQCHFFAGIGVWSHALRLAGWPDDRPVWTGSCPCQPFSSAGKGAGFADERHLWPAWHHLIRECRPAVVFGEQVASKDADSWIDLVCADLEAVGYPFGCVPFPAAGVGAPQPRDRSFWVARLLADVPGFRWTEERPNAGRLATGDRAQGFTAGPGAGCGPVNGFWAAADWIECCDPGGARWRPVEPGTFPLAHGAPARVGRLRAYGNAINAQAARVFVEAVMEV